MTPDTRRYISALAVLSHKKSGLDVYHNPFAEMPIFPDYFPHPEDNHWIKDGVPRSHHLWMEYTGSRDRNSRQT